MSRKLRGYILLFTEVIVMIVISYTFAFPYRVEGSSMEGSFYTGDRVFISHMSAWMGNIARGDSIVCDLNGTRVIKRVIAMPGDSIKIEDGIVYVNNKELKENYLLPDTYTGGDISADMGEDEYFVMGDNRGVSLDSRQEGSITNSDIKGKVVFKIG